MENDYDKSEFSDQKGYDTGLYAGLKFAFKITFTKHSVVVVTTESQSIGFCSISREQ